MSLSCWGGGGGLGDRHYCCQTFYLSFLDAGLPLQTLGSLQDRRACLLLPLRTCSHARLNQYVQRVVGVFGGF